MSTRRCMSEEARLGLLIGYGLWLSFLVLYLLVLSLVNWVDGDRESHFVRAVRTNHYSLSECEWISATQTLCQVNFTHGNYLWEAGTLIHALMVLTGVSVGLGVTFYYLEV